MTTLTKMPFDFIRKNALNALEKCKEYQLTPEKMKEITAGLVFLS